MILTKHTKPSEFVWCFHDHALFQCVRTIGDKLSILGKQKCCSAAVDEQSETSAKWPVTWATEYTKKDIAQSEQQHVPLRKSHHPHYPQSTNCIVRRLTFRLQTVPENAGLLNPDVVELGVPVGIRERPFVVVVLAPIAHADSVLYMSTLTVAIQLLPEKKKWWKFSDAHHYQRSQVG